MKIAILSTPTEPLPPRGYAGVGRVVYSLQKGLVQKGHDVTVFATGDCVIDGTLEYFYEKALGSSIKNTYNSYYFLNHVHAFFSFLQHNSFDIVHFNDAGRLSLYFAQYMNMPFVTTLHGSYELKKDDQYDIVAEKRNQLLLFKEYPFISVSNAQRSPILDLNFVSTVYNSLAIEAFDFNAEGGEYISWLGRVTPDKGLDSVLEMSQKLNIPTRLYGFVDEGQKQYFEETIKPLLSSNPNSVFLGEATQDEQKSELYGNSKLFLFPLRWDEPFGLVMIEAMACGTPVVAFARGAVPEVVVDGVTGFVVNPSDEDIRGDFVTKKTGMDGLQEAVERIYAMQDDEYRVMRQKCREHVASTFTIDAMTDAYIEAYHKVIAQCVPSKR